jgi:hypothetical protein
MYATILRKNLSTFLCPESLSEAEFKSSELINLVQEILRQHSMKLWHSY